MALRILVDTNIILDYLLCREPHEKAAKDIVVACKQRRVSGCVAAHSISNIFYILRKAFSVEERKSILINMCELFEVEGIDKAKILEALTDETFLDFEDCLQMECAIAFRADYIVTRNCNDFRGSRIPCIEPEEFLKMI